MDSPSKSLKRNHNEDDLSRSLKQRTYETSISKSQYERKLLAFETTKREFEITMREKNLQHGKLVKDISYYKDKAETAHKEKDAALALANQNKTENDKTQSQHRYTLGQLKEENIQLKMDLDSLQSQYTRQIHSKDSVISSIEHRCASLEEDLHSAIETSNLRQSLLENTRRSLDTLEQDKSSSNIDSSHAYTSFMRDELSKQSSINKHLESQNKSLNRDLNGLKEKSAKFDVLREEKLALSSKLKMLDRVSTQLSSVELERDSLLKEKEGWQDVLQPGESPATVTTLIAQLRLENATLRESVGSTNADKSGHSTELAQLLDQIDSLRKAEAQLQINVEKLTTSTTSQYRLLELSQQEVSSLKKQLDTILSEEETLNAHKLDTLHHDRMVGLEGLLQQHKSENEKLAREMFNLSKSTTTDTSNEKAFQLKIDHAEQTIVSLKAEAQEEINKLAEQVAHLEHKVGRGEFNCKNIRVLEMRDNPISQDYAIRSETLSALREENRMLLEEKEGREENVMQSVQSTHPSLPLQTTLNHTKEIKTLEQQLSDKDKRMLRLKGIFSDKAAEFREAIYSLLGYRVQFLPNGRVRLNSAYAASESGGILFQSNEDDQGTMKVEDGGLDGVEDLLRFWVNERESIPCFMANLCLELWDANERNERGRLAVR
ncbi:hypothetical protein E3P86_02441 [Wallemia ichthyophaga]|uniref:Spindle assembly checkpoint component MAD1 n=1 Tax=Wallemia ichthyophaga TaxID=245174 RepID=A0A4V4M601_WALIC|nr:hypothetical protein E3P86_02441 [Wallemia ichthyophaga]